MALNPRIRHVALLVAFATICIPVAAQDTLHPQDEASCRRFVQDFYSWYVPFTRQRLDGPAFDIALRRKATVFAPSLLRALKADSQAQRRASGDIVGIDFDPFISSQEPADHYDVRRIALQGDRCLVEVWRGLATDNSVKPATPDVIAELSLHSGRWQFENFRYPDMNTDLVAVLASLRKGRGEQ